MPSERPCLRIRNEALRSHRVAQLALHGGQYRCILQRETEPHLIYAGSLYELRKRQVGGQDRNACQTWDVSDAAPRVVSPTDISEPTVASSVAGHFLDQRPPAHQHHARRTVPAFRKAPQQGAACRALPIRPPPLNPDRPHVLHRNP